MTILCSFSFRANSWSGVEPDTSIMNSMFPERQRFRMDRSTVAPRLSELEMKQNCLVVMVMVRMVHSASGQRHFRDFVK